MSKPKAKVKPFHSMYVLCCCWEYFVLYLWVPKYPRSFKSLQSRCMSLWCQVCFGFWNGWSIGLSKVPCCGELTAHFMSDTKRGIWKLAAWKHRWSVAAWKLAASFNSLFYFQAGLNPFVDENNHTVAGSWTIVIVLPSHQWQVSCSSTWTCTHMPTHVAVCSMAIDFHPRCRRHVGVQTLGVDTRTDNLGRFGTWPSPNSASWTVRISTSKAVSSLPMQRRTRRTRRYMTLQRVPVKGVFRNGPNISNIIFHIVTRCYKNDQHQLQFRIQILQWMKAVVVTSG